MSMLNWKPTSEEMPIGVPLILSIRGLDGASDYVISNAYIIAVTKKYRTLLVKRSSGNFIAENLPVYAWDYMPEPANIPKPKRF